MHPTVLWINILIIYTLKPACICFVPICHWGCASGWGDVLNITPGRVLTSFESSGSFGFSSQKIYHFRRPRNPVGKFLGISRTWDNKSYWS